MNKYLETSHILSLVTDCLYLIKIYYTNLSSDGKFDCWESNNNDMPKIFKARNLLKHNNMEEEKKFNDFNLYTPNSVIHSC